MSTVVVGGGIIGLSAALELSRRSRDVVVLDAATDTIGASGLSCGWLTTAHSRPLANPANLRRSMGWLLRRRGPLSVRPHLDPALLRWLLGFAWNSRPGVDEAGLESMASLSGDALAAFDSFSAAGVAIDYQTAGTLVAFATGAGIDEEVEGLARAVDLGLAEISVLRGDAARALEPALAADIAGVVQLAGGRVTRPERLVDAIRDELRRRGVEIRQGERVRSFERSGPRVTAVRTEHGSVPADDVILAAGVWTTALAARLGVRVPVQAGRGYAIDIASSAGAPRHLVELGEASMVVVPFADGVRLCGTMEIAHADDPPDPRRSRLMLASVSAYLPDVEIPEEPLTRVASRPMTPDDLPIIGALPGLANVMVSTGHGMLGVTLGPVSAIALADQLEGRDGIDLRPFGPSRFA